MSTTEVQKLNEKMDRILFILDNDKGTGKKGLVAQFDQLRIDFDVFVNRYNVDRAVKKGKDTVWKIVFGAVGAAAIKGISFLYNLFIHIP